MSAVVVLGLAGLQLWVRTLARSLGAHRHTIVVGAAATVAVGLLLGFGTGAFLLAELPWDLPEGLRGSMRVAAFAGVALVGTCVSIVGSLTAPRTTALRTLAMTLPVGSASRALGLHLPAVLLCLIFSLAFSGASVVAGVRAASSVGHAVLTLLAVVALLIITVLTAAAVLELIRWSAERLRIPQPFSGSLAGALLLGCVGYVTIPELLPSVWAPGVDAVLREVSAYRSLAALLTSPTVVASGIVAGWIALALSAALASYRLPEIRRAPRTVLVARGGLPPRQPFLALVWFELLVALRAPQTWMTMLAAVAALAVAAAVSGLPGLGAMIAVLAGGSVLLPFAAPVYSVGRSMSSAWTVGVLGVQPFRWLVAKAVNAALVGAALAVPLGGVALALGLILPESAWQTVVRVPVMLGCALIAGTAIRDDGSQSLSAPIGGFVMIVLYLACTLLVSWASEAGALVGGAAALLLSVVLAGLYLLLGGSVIARAIHG